jgi:hypothetical protein
MEWLFTFAACATLAAGLTLKLDGVVIASFLFLFIMCGVKMTKYLDGREND